MANRRIFYAVQKASFAALGSNTFTAVHGLQSVGISTKFNLEQVFEIGQISIYSNVENIPDIEVTMEKALDGNPLIYHMATKGATSATLSGRSNIKTIVGLSIYPDTQDAASGTPIAQCTMSGMFVSALSYNVNVQGNSTESVTLVGNNKVWTNVYTDPALVASASGSLPNADVPLTSILRRQDFILGESASGSILPPDIPNVTSSGTLVAQADGTFLAHLQSFKASANLGRETLYELGHRGVYHRYVQFPVQVSSEIDVIASTGDNVQALENAVSNITPRQILIHLTDGTKIDLGLQNKLTSVNYAGANAGQNGGNATTTFSYITFNDFTVTHPQDPSGL